MSASAAASHELDAPPWLRVESTLMATARLIREAYDHRFTPLGLNLTLASILVYVADFSPVTQSKIAAHLGQGRAATGASIDRLQELGLVERRPDVEDRRVWQIHLTPAGQTIVEQIAVIDTGLRTELRDGVSRAERQALAQVLQTLQANLRRALTDTVSTPDTSGATSSAENHTTTITTIQENLT
jgi:DNA-binding MarR family transcriptional regulator